MGEMKNVYRILIDNLKGKDLLGYICTDGRIILIWILEK
jgi:hypothetical protein